MGRHEEDERFTAPTVECAAKLILAVRLWDMMRYDGEDS
jgi:hypothetical protein